MNGKGVARLRRSGSVQNGRNGRTQGLLTDRGRAMLAAGMTLTICGVGLGFDDLVRIGALATLLPLFSLLATRRDRFDLTARRTPSPPLTGAGQQSCVLLRLHNHGTRPTPVLLAEEAVGDGLGGPARAVIPSIHRGRHWAFEYPIRPLRRGRHVVGPLRLNRRDVFGLASSTIVLTEVAEIIALPIVHPLAGSSVTVGAGVEGQNPTLIALHGHDEASLRGYQEGDDLRRIHWPVTAHRGELMVRHEGRPTLRRALIMIGGYAAPPGGLTAGPGGSSAACAALDWMVEALASIAVHLAGAGYALHVLTPETLEAATAGLLLSPAHALRALAVVEPEPPDSARSRSPLAAAARELAGAGVVVITAIGDHDDAMAREVLSIKGVTAPGMVFVLDTESFRAPGHPSRADHLDRPGDSRRRSRADELAALARSGGWRVAVVRSGDTVTRLWAAMNSPGARIGDGSPR